MNISKNIRNKIAVALGSSLDWYDFALYGFFASTLANLFFPSSFNQTHAIIYTFGIWFIGFAARPLGAIIFGYIGDKYGRAICFKVTSVLIFLPVFAFPILPTYNQIGFYAPMLVIILRIIQGICIGGEFAGNIIYLCETSPKKENYFYGSLGSCTGSFGILMASIVSSVIHYSLSQVNIEAFGWRLAFALAIIFAVISFMMRRTISETEVFKKENINLKQYSLLNMLTKEWKNILLACGVIYLHATSFYMLFIFFPTFLNKYLAIEMDKVLVNNSLLLAARILIIPFVGMLADRVGGRVILMVSCGIFILISYPLFQVISMHNRWLNVAVITLALVTTLNAGTVPGLLIKMLPVSTRYSTLSIAFNICFGVFGGIVPSLSIFLIERTGFNIAPAFYLVGSASITFLVLKFLVKEEKYE